ncbi:MAG: YggS family pyridoxal phosphate-dependent enzyme [Lachnospiraceae bacterium]|nr:YggS family pyridoxal phosphate-dependent enzyme [Lachnospiraceae bacterium]
MVKENLKTVEENIKKACERAGRDVNSVTLIAVSKTKPIELMKEAEESGIINFGENKVQEICNKHDSFGPDIKWHMIGHLQRNKVKQVIDKVALIHSVDSYRLAQEISVQAQKLGITVPVLLEVNIANEETKFGSSKEDVIMLAEEISELPNIEIKGLMTVAPETDNPEENRAYFREIRQLSFDIKNKNINNVSMDVLSMGMTGDYEVAIEEGSTMVRVGTGIFGARNYNK